MVIFVAGVVTGGLLATYTNVAAVPPVRRAVPGEAAHSATTLQSTNTVHQNRLPTPLPGPLRKDFLDRLQKELKIDPAQRERIEKIISEGQEEADTLWLEIEPDMHRVLVETKEKIRAELTAEQKKKSEDLLRPRFHIQPKPAENPTNAPPATLTNCAAAKI